MLIPLTYGTERTPIGMGEYLVKCPHCETDQWAEIMVSSVYSHIYYVPLLPNYKDAFVVCNKCGLKRYDVPFNSKLISNFDEVKKLYRHKWYTYTGVGIMALPFVFWLLFVIIGLFR